MTEYNAAVLSSTNDIQQLWEALCSGNTLDLHSGDAPFETPAWTPAILTKVLRSFPLYLQGIC
jgi:hypothetical protein